MKRRIVCKCIACNRPFIQKYWEDKITFRRTCNTKCSAVFKEVYSAIKDNPNRKLDSVLEKETIKHLDKQKVINVYNAIKKPDFRNIKFECYDEVVKRKK